MVKVFDGNEKVGELVAAFPGASNLLKSYKIDFCCGGDRVLSAALEQKSIDAGQFLQALNQLYNESLKRAQRDTDWRHAAYSELIDHVIVTHHAYLNEELPLLGQFVTKILRVHGAEHPELSSLHTLFNKLRSELEQHLIAEEEVVFPLIKQYEQSGAQELLQQVRSAIDELEDEHEKAGQLLKEIRAVTNDFTLPAEACRTYTLTFQKLEELESDIFQHVHLENNIMFARLLAAEA